MMAVKSQLAQALGDTLHFGLSPLELMGLSDGEGQAGLKRILGMGRKGGLLGPSTGCPWTFLIGLYPRLKKLAMGNTQGQQKPQFDFIES